jgi:D-alanyl-D-alanine carboxypeptidase
VDRRRLLVPLLALLVVLATGVAWDPGDARSGGSRSEHTRPRALATGADPVGRTTADRLDAIVAEARTKLHAPALVVMLRLDDGTTWGRALGDATLPVDGRRTPVTLDTPFVLGSLTKSFVASALLQLAAKGRVDLDAPIAGHLPAYPNASAITLRMLLRHTAGLYDYFLNPRYESLVFGRPTHAWTYGEILRLVLAPYRPPGTGFTYSNTGYILAGRILGLVTGRDVAQVIRTRFLRPLGLTSMSFQGREAIRGVAAKGYLWSGSRYLPWSDGSAYRPNRSAATVADTAGAMLGSARDLLAWSHALYGGQVLSPDALDQMLDFGRKSGYGIAAKRYDEMAGWVAYGHGGSLRGYVAMMVRVPEPGIDLVILTNVGRVNIASVARRVVRAVAGRAPTPSPSPDASVGPSPSPVASVEPSPPPSMAPEASPVP